MESIYWVMSWLCHRNCVHCYEDRFHPYYGDELRAVADQSKSNYRKVIEHLPDRMVFVDPLEPTVEKRGRIILAGGEMLLEAVREPVLYPALDLLYEKYKDVGGINLIVQTTGDLLTEKIVRELIAHHVTTISVSGIDAFHQGMEEEPAREALRQKLTKIFESNDANFHFFGATKDSWIGKIWPRGRAQLNELSTATLADNFCNAWSGGLNFLDLKHAGSEVSIEPSGLVYPCCMKTKKAIGNLTEEPLETIIDRLKGNPVYEAISMGHPERMGISHGWSVEKFYKASEMVLPSGCTYQNLCIGCDKFHDEMLSPLIVLQK